MYLFTTTMKTVQQKLGWAGTVAGVALLASVFSSCSKHVDNSTPQAPTANMAVIDVSPTAPNLDFYLDGAKVNSGAINYVGGLEYFICYAGKRYAQFYQSGTSTIVASDSVNLKANTAYTLLLSNLPATPDVTLIRDSIYIPAANTATVRFVNASPDAGAVDFGMKGQPLLGSNIAYRKSTPFVQVNITNALTDTLLVYQTGTSTVIQKVPIALQQEGVFTAYLYGFAGQTSTTEKLGLGVMENTYFY